ncbi:MAG: septum formation protein Maf [Rhodobacteraceae bacterium CG17_big_fil_post_rev_8_21_14_2_50_63_15]|nr:septum formation protein Maf [Roseovarius sp.]PIV78376.1 MAG: septum formation protein Maf [Rhodobacteraceae bacterium CG17_big_fil_post_rev_8_21_14_2_50_63_15]
MTSQIILASGSAIRQSLLTTAGLRFAIQPARIDEEAVTEAMLANDSAPREIADALAELKALKVSQKAPEALVIGCDQVLSLDRRILHKPRDTDDCRAQLLAMRGRQHDLFSAVVICQEGRAIWRHVGRARMSVRFFSNRWMKGYIDRNWESIRHSVGGYRLEEEGVRLFTQVEGDYFTVLGLPLLELLGFLTERGDLEQ